MLPASTRTGSQTDTSAIETSLMAMGITEQPRVQTGNALESKLVATCVLLGAMLFAYNLAHYLPSGTMELFNWMLPAILLSWIAVQTAQLLIQRPAMLWTPLPWFLISAAVYYGLGPLVYTFGKNATLAQLAVLPIDNHDLWRTNVLNTCGIGLILLVFLFVSRHLRLDVAAAQTRLKVNVDESAEAAAKLFLLVGIPIKYLIILPWEMGGFQHTLPGLIVSFSDLTTLAILVVAYLSVRRPRQWRHWLWLLFSAELFVEVLRFSKLNTLLLFAMLTIGLYFATQKFRVLLKWGFVIVVVYVFLTPIVSAGRNEIVARYDVFSKASLGERLEITRHVTENHFRGQSRVEDDAQWWWMRLSYASIQTVAMDYYDSDRGGNSYRHALYAFVPRVIMPSKPSMTEISIDFNEMLFDHRNSAVSTGIFAEAYWNGGWGMLLPICALVGTSLAWLSFVAVRAIGRGQWLFLPCILWGIKMGFRHDGWFVPDYLGTFVLFLFYFVAIRFLYPSSARTSSRRSTQSTLRPALPAPRY